MWKCYLLATADGGSKKTYVGITPDLDRRLEQHNGLRAGGAAATKGRKWARVCHVKGFPDHTAALQFEWRWKKITRGFGTEGTPLFRRFKALQQLLALDRSTTKAAEYTEWTERPEVVMEIITDFPAL